MIDLVLGSSRADSSTYANAEGRRVQYNFSIISATTFSAAVSIAGPYQKACKLMMRSLQKAWLSSKGVVDDFGSHGGFSPLVTVCHEHI